MVRFTLIQYLASHAVVLYLAALYPFEQIPTSCECSRVEPVSWAASGPASIHHVHPAGTKAAFVASEEQH